MRATAPRTYSYRRYGLQIDSEIECPGLKRGAGGDDIVIRAGQVAAAMPDPSAEGVLYQVQPGRFLFSLDGIARYEASEGRRIVVDAASRADPESVRLFLFGPPMAALLQQRGLLVLHGSAVEVNGSAVMFLGASGFGKSTLAAAFSQRGHHVLSDDTCVLEVPGEDVEPRLLVGGHELKLWVDSVESLGLDPEALRRVRPEGRRRSFGSRADYPEDSAAVRHIYRLHPAHGEEVRIERLTGAERFAALMENLYQHRYLLGHGKLHDSFRQCAGLAARAEVSAVHRPIESFRIEELYDRIHADLN